MSYEIEKRIDELQKLTQDRCDLENEKPENEEEESERQNSLDCNAYESEEVTKEIKSLCASAGEQIENAENLLGITEGKSQFPMWTIK
jgi:hypothetical protein